MGWLARDRGFVSSVWVTELGGIGVCRRGEGCGLFVAAVTIATPLNLGAFSGSESCCLRFPYLACDAPLRFGGMGLGSLFFMLA